MNVYCENCELEFTIVVPESTPDFTGVVRKTGENCIYDGMADGVRSLCPGCGCLGEPMRIIVNASSVIDAMNRVWESKDLNSTIKCDVIFRMKKTLESALGCTLAWGSAEEFMGYVNNLGRL